MQTRLVSYAIFGAKGSVLPDFLQSTVTTPLGELPTGEVHYPLAGVAASGLKSESEVAFEYWNGTAWVEPPNARFIPMGGDFDRLEDVQTCKYKLLGFGWLLRQAKVWEAGGLPLDADGKVQFLSATPGNIMATLLTKAKARGWGSGVAFDFSAAVDSSGAAWPSVVTMSFDLEISLETILNNLYQQGLVDYRWEGRTLRMFKPGTTMARERAARLPIADGVTSAPETWTDEDRLTDTLVIGEKGARWTFNNGATGGFGRLEKVQTQSGVSDPATAQLLAQADLIAGLDTRVSYTREFDLTLPALFEPFAYYLPGDWVQAQRGTAFERLRVMSISVTTAPDKVTGHAVLGDRIDDILSKLAKRTSGITGGATAGGTGGRPAPEGPDKRTPSAPTALIVSSAPYINENGFPRGRIQADWSHSLTATNGTTQTPDRYQLQRRINTTGTKYQTVAEVESTTAVVIDVPIFKADGVTPEAYAHRVRAVSDAGLVSAWSSVTVTTMQTDTTAPAAPYFVQANVTTWLRTVKVTWDGTLTTTGSNHVTIPLDFHHVDVHMDTQASMATKTKIGEIYGTLDFVMVPAAAAGTTLYFTLTAVDRSGNSSPASAVKNITPQANVDAAEILATLNAASVTLTNVGSAALLDKAVLTSKLADNAVDQGKLAQTVNDAIAQGTSAYGSISGINSSISTLTSSVNGKNSITNSTSVPSDTTNPGTTVGDRWQKWTTLAAGGKITNTYRWTSGNTWYEEALSASYIPLLDIGSGTFGSLDGGRLTAKTVTTESLLVGDFTNLVDDPNCDGPGWYDNGSDPVVAGNWSVNGDTVRGWRLDSDTVSPDVRVNNRNVFTVEPDTELYLEATVSNRTNGTLYYRIYWCDTAGTVLATGGISDLTFPARAAGDSGWSTLSRSVTPPAGARKARLSILISTGSTTGSAYVIRPMVRRKNGGNLFIDGSVTASAVATNALTAKQILIGDFQNFALGSDFEDVTAVPWTLDPLHTITTTQKKSGTRSLRLAPGTGSHSSTLIADVRVKEGEQYNFKYWAYIDGTFNGTSSNSKLRVADQTGAAFVVSSPFNAIARSQWVPMEMTYTVGAGTTSLSITLVSDHTTGYGYIDDVQIRRVAEASLIQNLGVEKLIAGTASIDSAVIDKLWTDVVNSRKITTDMLIVSGENLIPDPFFFDADQNTYRLATGGPHYLGTDSASTAQIIQFRDHSVAGGNVRLHTIASRIKVIPGEEYNLMVDYRYRGTTVAGAAQGTIKFTIFCDGPSGNFIRTVNLTTVTRSGANGTGWLTLNDKYTIPADTGFIRISVGITNEISTGDVELRMPRMKRKMSADLIVDGGIIADHLTVTDAMWVKVIKFKKLTGLEIDVNSLTADTAWIGTLRGGILINDAVDTGMLKADSITSKHTITGATLQTVAAANSGIKISGNYLRAYHPTTGDEVFTVSGNSGAVIGTGTWQTGSAGNYIKMYANANGGIMHLFTGSGSGRGSIWARAGADDRMSLTYSNLDEPTGTLPVVVLTAAKAYMNYGSRTIQVWNNAGTEELLLDATGASIVARGNLDMRDGRIQLRYGSATPLGYVGQAPASGSSPDFEVRADAGKIRLAGLVTNLSTYSQTTTSGANLVIDASGNFLRSTSAARYKTDIRRMELPDSILDVKVKDWYDTAAYQKRSAMNALPRPFTENMQADYDAIVLDRVPGLIAEDLLEHGADQFVIFGTDGQTEGVRYDRFAFAQIEVLKRQLDELRGQVNALLAA